MTVSIYSFAIFVTELEPARVFYHEVLGLPIRAAGSFGFELLDSPPHIAVHPANHPEGRSMVGRHTGITLRVPDLLHFSSHLGEAGVRFVSEPTQQGFGMMAMIADPDGNVLALWEDNVSPPKEEA